MPKPDTDESQGEQTSLASAELEGNAPKKLDLMQRWLKAEERGSLSVARCQ